MRITYCPSLGLAAVWSPQSSGFMQYPTEGPMVLRFYIWGGTPS